MHLEYDEAKALEFIKNYVPQDLKDKITEDDIDYVVDIMYEYYEEQGLLDDDEIEESVVEIDEEDIISYVLDSMNDDSEVKLTHEEISFIIQAELAYCDSIGIFE